MILAPRVTVREQGAIHVERIKRWGGSLLGQNWTIYIETEQKRPDANTSYVIGGREAWVWLEAPDTDMRRTLMVRPEDDRDKYTWLEILLPVFRVPSIDINWWLLRSAKTWRDRLRSLRYMVADRSSWMVTSEWEKWGITVQITRIVSQSNRDVNWTPHPDERPRAERDEDDL